VLSLRLEKEEDVATLLRLNARRKERYPVDTEYIPVTIDDEGKIQDAKVVACIKDSNPIVERVNENQVSTTPEVTETPEEVPAEADLTKTILQDDNNAEEDVVEVDGALQGEVVSLVVGEEEGVPGDCAGTGQLTITTPTQPLQSFENTSREEVVQLIKVDDTLSKLRDLADHNESGYEWDTGLLFRVQLDYLGNNTRKLCVPKQLRERFLTMAHERFRHNGRNYPGCSIYQVCGDTLLYTAGPVQLVRSTVRPNPATV